MNFIKNWVLPIGLGGATLILLCALAKNFISEATVYTSRSTGECVKVEYWDDQYNCHNLPPTFMLITVP